MKPGNLDVYGYRHWMVLIPAGTFSWKIREEVDHESSLFSYQRRGFLYAYH
jgi:hypothetical protein